MGNEIPLPQVEGYFVGMGTLWPMCLNNHLPATNKLTKGQYNT